MPGQVHKIIMHDSLATFHPLVYAAEYLDLMGLNEVAV